MNQVEVPSFAISSSHPSITLVSNRNQNTHDNHDHHHDAEANDNCADVDYAKDDER
jgi:hypothetical protein